VCVWRHQLEKVSAGKALNLCLPLCVCMYMYLYATWHTPLPAFPLPENRICITAFGIFRLPAYPLSLLKAKFQLPSCRFSFAFFGMGARTQAQLTHAHKLHFYADILLFAMAGFSFLEANALKNRS